MTFTSPMVLVLISSTSLCVCGWQRYMNASIAKTPLARAASKIAIASAWLIPMGFSHSTCLPASAARMAQ